MLTHFVSYNLCMGFIFSQVILLSATMPQEVLEVTSKFMRDPVRILVKKEELTLEGIRQFYINVEKEVSGEFRVESNICISKLSKLLLCSLVTQVVMLFCDDPHACQLIPDFLQCSVSDSVLLGCAFEPVGLWEHDLNF